jgi:hypothetical protein
MSSERCKDCGHGKKQHMRNSRTFGPCRGALIHQRTHYLDEKTGKPEKTGYMVSGGTPMCTCQEFQPTNT